MPLPLGTLTHFPVQTGHHRVSFNDQFTVVRVGGQNRDRDESERLGHGAVDIGSTEGTRVFAATSGQVPYELVLGSNNDRVPGSGTRNGSGNYVIIVNRDGYLFYYFHMQLPPLVAPGDRIASGQQIGFMGNTGLRDRNPNAPVHLHFQAVSHFHGHPRADEWYRDMRFGIKGRNLDPFPELDRLAVAIPGAVQVGLRRPPRGVIIDPPGGGQP
jgi:murein DD-endopeptidase MepM/ murein hydrolase activator NlpD